MGEKKRRLDRLTPQQQAALLLTRQLANDGRMIEGGWAAFQLLHLAGKSEAEMQPYRLAFYHGAEHLWSSVFATLDGDREPTDGDMARMASIQSELDEWRKHMIAMGMDKPSGTAN